jgi:ribosome hibernation promoting factor
MKFHVTSKNDAVPPALREYAERRVAEIEHFGQEFEKTEIVLDIERHETVCEIVLHPRRGEVFVATDRASEGRAAVDGAATKLERQYLKLKQKNSDAKRRPSAD